MKIILSLTLVALALVGCVSQQAGRLSLVEQHRIMQEVAASRQAAATAFAEYAGACLDQFPGATNVRDDGGDHLSVQGGVNVALNDNGHDIVCSVNIASRKIERIWFNQRTYTPQEYVNAEVERKKTAALVSVERTKILSGDYEEFVKAGKLSVSYNLKDPESARFRGLFISNKNLPTLCGEVNAKNSYGGYVGYKKFFYNRVSSFIDDGKELGDGFMYKKLAPDYCGDKFADIN
jgi:hypothetical protein